MTQSDFGKSMARLFGLDSIPVVRTRRIQNAGMLVTRLDILTRPLEEVSTAQVADGFVASVTMANGYERESWVDRRNIPVLHPHPAGALAILDLRMKNEIRLISPVNSVQFYFPKDALTKIATDNELTPLDEVHSPLGWIHRDPIFAALAQSMLLPFEIGEDSLPLFVEHVVTAAAIHFLTRHGGAVSQTTAFKGGLSPWQQRRVIELLDECRGELSLELLARTNKLSVRHFTRAFTQSFGMPPYKWLLRRRVELSKNLLREGRLAVEDVAVAMGFADQSHFSRVFKQVVGASPAAWRRAMASAPTFSIGSAAIHP